MSNVTAGIVALVVVLAATYLGFTKKIPFQQHFEIRAAFRSSNDIKPNSPVRIAGVEVGRVSKVEPTAKGASSAIITMKINDNGRPIHADARAKIRPRIFLEGNFFVDLTAGSPSAPVLGDGDQIPATQTSTPVQFSQVLAALNRPSRENLQLTLGELSTAFDAGLAKNFRTYLPDVAPAYKFSAIVAEALLGRRPHDLSDTVRDVGTTAAGLDRSPGRLKSLLENFDITAGALAREDTALAAAVGELPRTLAAASPALDSLNAAFPSVRRFAVDALPGVESSGPAVAALRPLVAQLHQLVGENELRGLSRDLAGATPGLVKLSTRSIPLWKQLRPLASCVNNVILPWSQDTVPDAAFPEHGPVFQSAVKWLPGLAGESRSFDANGQWFKVLGSGGAETVQLGNGLFGFPLFQVEGSNPPATKIRPPLRPNVPCETQEKPNLATVPVGPPATTNTRQSAAARERYETAKKVALLSLQNQFALEGKKVKIADGEMTPAMVEELARRAGNLDQLNVLRQGLPLTSDNIRKAGG
jgi:virulence factor Mce-like protein